MAMADLSTKSSTVCSRKYATVLSPFNVNRVGVESIANVKKIFDADRVSPLFGEVNLEELLALSYIAVQIDDDQGDIAGVLIANLYPNISAVPPWEWKSWLNNLYGLEEVHPRNCLWIHLLLWDPCYYFLFLRPIIQYLFQNRNFLEFVMLVLPPNFTRTEFLGELGTLVLPIGCDDSHHTQALYLMQKQDFVIKYKMRRAVEEDNDDLIPLIDMHSKRLQQIYGSFYIAELLTRHKDSGRQIIVAEYQGVAVALIILNETVNYKALNDEFELITFNGLKKPHPEDTNLFLDVDYPSSEQLPTKLEEEVAQIVDRPSSASTESESQESFLKVSLSSSEDYSLVFTSASMFVFQDDEDKESNRSEDSQHSEQIMAEYRTVYEKHRGPLDLDVISTIVEWSTKNRASYKIPEFFGDDNAFSLEVAASHPEHERALLMLFESAFECYPDRDYCIMSLPATAPINRLNNYFARVIPRPTGAFPYEVYVLHKSAVLSELSVKTATRQHETGVKQLLSTIPYHNLIQQKFDNYLNVSESIFLAYVLLSEDQIVGFTIVSEAFEVDFLKATYDLWATVDPMMYKTGSHGILECLVMAPMFEAHSKFFIREIHRISDYSILYYKHVPVNTMITRDPLLNVLHNLLHIMPRNLPDQEQKKPEETVAPHGNTEKQQDAFALYLSILPLCSVHRYTVNTRLVIIGSSNTALAFMASLLLTQSKHHVITFNNVTLVSQFSLNRFKIPNKIHESFLVQKNFMDARYMDMIGLRTYINIVQGKVTKIDRREQHLVINEKNFLPYDLLFLMAGERFRKPLRENRTTFPEDPDNVFLINDAIDAHRAVINLKQLLLQDSDPDYIIIVYGHFLQAYTTLHGLLTFGVPGPHMCLIEPFPFSMNLEKKHRHNVSVFNDPDVGAAVLEQIRAQGIEVYCSYYFKDWDYDPADNVITMARFESRHNMLEMPCAAMFYFTDKGISPRIYKVINDAGLVFDGRLVIDPYFRTNDPRIYGAGTLTKYSRKYYANHMTHKYFNRVEIGQKLGLQIKNMLIPPRIRESIKRIGGWNFHLERGDTLVPRYEQPIMRYCRLPGGLYYLSIVKPGRSIPLETAINMDNYGQVLITGNCRNVEKQGFFRLHLNAFKRVETITCLTKFPIEIRNICCLWGKHEKLLNNLQLRFEMVLITDLFEYFREPWACAIYHDRFDTLLEELNMLMTSAVGGPSTPIVCDIIDMYQDRKWKPLSQDEKDIIEEKFAAQAYPKIIEKKVLDFVRQNLDSLPMYAHPIVIKALLEGFNKSPLFTY